jgi:hypothetical protein
MKRSTKKSAPAQVHVVSMPTPDDALAEVEAARALRIHVETLRKIRREGKGPTVRWIGRRPIYIRRDLVAWLEGQT